MTISLRSRRWIALSLGVLTLMAAAFAADHFDSPLSKRDVRTDITDVYAFRSPANPDNLVVVMGVSSFVPGAAPNPLFSNRARYNIHVDNVDDGNLKANATVQVTFSGTTNQKFRLEGLGKPITGSVNEVVSSGAIKVFCGPRDDPFFFDLTAFQSFVAGPYIPAAGLRATGAGAPTDFFAGRNIAAITLELPITALTGRSTSNQGVIKAWTTITEPDPMMSTSSSNNPLAAE